MCIILSSIFVGCYDYILLHDFEQFADPAVQSGATKSGAITVKTSGYPDFDIYPPVLRKRLPDVQVVKLVWNYPIFDLCESAYSMELPGLKLHAI